MKLKLGSKAKEPDPKEPESGPFGVKSYLHQFYQTPQESEIGQYLLPGKPKPNRIGLYVCRFLTIIGLVLFLIGAAGIVLGYTWPRPSLDEAIRKIERFEDSNGMIWIPKDKIHILMADPMRSWKFVSLGIFAAGGVVLAISLIIPACASTFGNPTLAGFASELDTPTDMPIKIYTGQESHQIQKDTNDKVPTTEAIKSVQPEPEEKQRKQADQYLISEE